ncbi:hypothetical protein [Porphyromonas pogonae]|nr:hypothetical protein [Porphyromonas pogonae]
MTKRESRKQRSNWPAMQRSLFMYEACFIKQLINTDQTNSYK